MVMIYSLMVTISAAFWMSSHPVMFMSLILIQTVIMSMSMWITSSCSWFSFILFLIFLGGLMVLFIYITSLASNELISYNINSIITFFFMSTTSLWVIIFMNKNVEMYHYKETNMMNFFMDIYSENLTNMILLVMIYLLLTLIIAVKISNKKEAPMKSSYN